MLIQSHLQASQQRRESRQNNASEGGKDTLFCQKTPSKSNFLHSLETKVSVSDFYVAAIDVED